MKRSKILVTGSAGHLGEALVRVLRADRRVDISDVVSAHLLALDKAPSLRFAKYTISATTPLAFSGAGVKGHHAVSTGPYTTRSGAPPDVDP